MSELHMDSTSVTRFLPVPHLRFEVLLPFAQTFVMRERKIHSLPWAV